MISFVSQAMPREMFEEIRHVFDDEYLRLGLSHATHKFRPKAITHKTLLCRLSMRLFAKSAETLAWWSANNDISS
jgi:hypothetical protein